MLREFTQDIGRLFTQGEVRDFPKNVWKDIARSAKKKLDKFTRPLQEGLKGQTGKKAKAVTTMQAKEFDTVDQQVPKEQVGSDSGDSKDANAGTVVRPASKRARLNAGTK